MYNTETIYVIEVMEKLDLDERGFPDFGATRCPGFYHSMDEAEADVTENHCDIFECSFRYAVIHEVRPGVYPHYEQRKFYHYDTETDRYTPIEEPEFLSHYGICIIG